MNFQQSRTIMGRKLVLETTPAKLLLLLVLSQLILMCVAHGPLRVGHYALSCPTAESIVRQAMERSMQQDRSIVAGVLRLHFHDCFVEVPSTKPLVSIHDSQAASRKSTHHGA